MHFRKTPRQKCSFQASFVSEMFHSLLVDFLEGNFHRSFGKKWLASLIYDEDDSQHISTKRLLAQIFRRDDADDEEVPSLPNN